MVVVGLPIAIDGIGRELIRAGTGTGTDLPGLANVPWAMTVGPYLGSARPF